MKIPKSFKLFSTTYNVVFNNEKLNDRGEYGHCSYSKCEIALSTHKGVIELSSDRILDTYYHEKVHAILDMMGEDTLSSDERFVDIFSKLLRQSDETSIFDK